MVVAGKSDRVHSIAYDISDGLPTTEFSVGTQQPCWKSQDGLDIEGLLTYPVNYQKGTRYPLLLNVHGGPSLVFTQTFVATPKQYPIATFSARGITSGRNLASSTRQTRLQIGR